MLAKLVSKKFTAATPNSLLTEEMELMVNDFTCPFDVKVVFHVLDGVVKGFLKDNPWQVDSMDVENCPPSLVAIESIAIGQYAKLYGAVKYDPIRGKHIQLFKLFPMKELNEITHHMLACINESIFHSEKKKIEKMEVDKREAKYASLKLTDLEKLVSNINMLIIVV